jgi:hypothetical protein
VSQVILPRVTSPSPNDPDIYAVSVPNLFDHVRLDHSVAAMANLYTLLTLPVSSTAFSELPDVTGREDDDDGSGSPLRKAPRLGSSSDSASASRYRNANSKARERDGPVHMQLVGDPSKSRLVSDE